MAATRYLNTDLDLVSDADLTQLVRGLEAHGLFALHVTHGDDGRWRASLETEDQHDEPGPNIAALLAAVESLSAAERRQWSFCSLRELNIGFECDASPGTLGQAVPGELLGRIATIGASLAVTLYLVADATVGP